MFVAIENVENSARFEEQVITTAQTERTRGTKRMAATATGKPQHILRGLNAINTNYFPVKHELAYFIRSLSQPRVLLVERITLAKKNGTAAEMSSSTKPSGDDRLFYIHAASKFITIFGVEGGTLVKAAPPEKSGLTPDEYDVATIQIHEPKSSEKKNTADSSEQQQQQHLSLVLYMTVHIDDVEGIGLYRGTAPSLFWATHFEPIQARRAFACLDEPTHRASYAFSFYLQDTEENSSLTVLNGALPVGEGDKKPVAWTTVKFQDIFNDKSRFPTEAVRKLCEAEVLDAQQQQQQQQFRVFAFRPMEKIQSYLNAFSVGRWQGVAPEGPEYVSPLTGKTIPCRLYIHQERDPATARFAVSVLRFALEFFERYFNIPFPFDKNEALAPSRFSIGGMENNALILLKEQVLLNEESCSGARLEQVCNLISHEVSHAYFGNAVGMGVQREENGSAWSLLFLKEAFASLFGAVAAGHYPTANLDDNSGKKVPPRFPGAIAGMIDDVFAALKVDSFEETHSVEQQLHDGSTVASAFDELSYNKGQSIVMMCMAAAPDKFRSAISGYLKKFMWQHPTSADLWESLEAGTGVKGLARSMDSFCKIPGHPVVSVRVENKSLLVISQSKYRTAARKRSSFDEDPLWVIPLDVDIYYKKSAAAAVEVNTVKIVLSTRIDTIDIGSVIGGDSATLVAVNCNVDHRSFVRSEYADDTLFAGLLSQFASLSPASAVGIIENTHALTRAQRRPEAIAQMTALIKVFSAELRQISDLANITRYDAITTATSVFPAFARTFVPRLLRSQQGSKGEAAAAALLDLCFSGLAALALKMGSSTVVDGEDPRLSDLRPLVWSAVAAGAQLCSLLPSSSSSSSSSIAIVRHLRDDVFAPFLASATAVAKARAQTSLQSAEFKSDANMLTLQLRVAIAFSSESNTLFDSFLAAVKAAPDAIAARDVVLALAHTPDEGRLRAVAEEVFGSVANPATETFIRQQMGHIMTAQLAANRSPAAKTVLWSVFTERIKAAVSRWGTGQFRMASICASMASVMDDEAMYSALFRENPIPMATQAIGRGAEEIQVRTAVDKMKELDELLVAAMA